MRDGFVFYRSFFESFEDLSKKDKLILFDALCNYALNDIVPELTGTTNAIFKLLKPQVDANNRRYENGKKGGRPKKHSDEALKAAQKDRNSEAYKEWRDAVFKRDNYTCQMCGSVEDLHAHHKMDFVEYPALRFDINNGMTLCRSCHNEVHSKPSDNQAITKNKPSANQTKPKEKDKDKDKDKVKEKDKDKQQDKGLGSSRVRGGGVSDGDEFNIWKKLDGAGIDAIYDAYPESGGFLIEEVAAEVRNNRRTVDNAVGYVLGYAKRVGWDDNADHFDGGGLS